MNNLLSLLNNFDHALKANEIALNSAGSAAQENARYMEGLEAKTSAVKASFEKLAASVVDSGLIKSLLDLANAILKLLDTPVGVALTQTALLTGVLWGGSGLIKAMKIIPNLLGKVTTGVTLFGKAVSISVPHLAAIAIALGVLIRLGPKVVDWYRRQTDVSYDAEQELKELNVRLSENQARLEELNAIPYANRTQEIRDEISALEDQNEALRDNIDLKSQVVGASTFGESLITGIKGVGEEQKGVSLYSPKEDKDFFFENVQDMFDFLVNSGRVAEDELNHVREMLGELGNDAGRVVAELGYSFENEVERIASPADVMEVKLTTLRRLIKSFQQGETVDMDFAVQFDDARHSIDKLLESASEFSDEALFEVDLGWIVDLREQFADIPDISAQVADSYYSISDSLFSLQKGMAINQLQRDQLVRSYPQFDSVLKETANGFIADSETARQLAIEIGKIDPVFQDLVNGMTVTQDEITSLTAKYPELTAAIEKNAEGYYLNIEALAAAAEAGNEWAIAVIQEQAGATKASIEGSKKRLEALKEEYQAFLAVSGRYVDLSTKFEFENNIRELEAYISNLESISGVDITAPDIQVGGGSGSSSGSHEKETDPIKEQSKLFKEQLAILEHKLYLMQKTGASEEDQIAHIKEMQKLVHEQAEWFREHGVSEDSEYIRELQKQWWQYEEQIQGIYKDQASIYEMLFGAVAEKAQNEIDALEKKKAEIQEQNEALEDQIELEKALDALARAKQQKKLVYKDGRFQYVQDVDAVSKAQAEVDRIKKEQEKQKELDAIDKEIDKWQEYKDKWSSVVSDYTKQQDLLLIEQKLGIKLEGENWEKRLGNLADYVKRYNELMAKAGQTGGNSAKPNGHYASGTTSARGGISLVGETGPELRLLNHGDGILPADITKNLWQWGAIDPSSLVGGAVGNLRNLGNSVSIAIENFNPNLPNVTDGEGFANYMKNNFYRDALQFAR